MNIQLSRRIKTNETASQSPTLKRKRSRVVRLSAAEALPTGGIELPVIDDSVSIQRALSVVINAVAAGTLDPARAKVLLYGLQIASANARRVASSPKAEEVVRTVEGASDAAAIPVAPAINASDLREPQAASLNERELEENKDKHAEMLEQDPKPVDAIAETSASPATDPQYPGQVRIPPSCFSPANGYSSGARERLLGIRQQAESHRKGHVIW